MRPLIWSAHEIPRLNRAPCQVRRYSLQSVVEVYRETNAEQAEAGDIEHSRIETAFYVEYCREWDSMARSHRGRTLDAVLIFSLGAEDHGVNVL